MKNIDFRQRLLVLGQNIVDDVTRAMMIYVFLFWSLKRYFPSVCISSQPPQKQCVQWQSAAYWKSAERLFFSKWIALPSHSWCRFVFSSRFSIWRNVSLKYYLRIFRSDLIDSYLSIDSRLYWDIVRWQTSHEFTLALFRCILRLSFSHSIEKEDLRRKAGWKTDTLNHPITVVNKPASSQGFCSVLSVSWFRYGLSDFSAAVFILNRWRTIFI